MIKDIESMLDSIDPASLSYSEWLSVGMALKEEGHTPDVWDKWSRRDGKRYNEGECLRKWNGFTGSATPVTGGTVAELAKRNGYVYKRDKDETASDLEIKGHFCSLEPAEQLLRYVDAL